MAERTSSMVSRRGILTEWVEKVADCLSKMKIASSIDSGARGHDQKNGQPDQEDDDDHPDPVEISMAMFELGKEQFLEGKFGNAIRFFDEAIGLNNTNYLFHYKQAEAWLKLEDYQKAEEAVKRAKKLKPGDQLLKNTGQKVIEAALRGLGYSKGVSSTYSKYYASIEEALQHVKKTIRDEDTGPTVQATKKVQDDTDDFKDKILHRSHSYSRSSQHSGSSPHKPDMSRGRDDEKKGSSQRRRSKSPTKGSYGKDKLNNQSLRSRARTPARSVINDYSNLSKSVKPIFKTSMTTGRERSKSRAGGDGYASDTGSARSMATTVRRTRVEALQFVEADRIKPANLFGHQGIFVRFLDAAVPPDKVREAFEAFGHVVEFHPYGDTCRVIYDNADSPTKAIYKYHMKNVEGLAYQKNKLIIRFEAMNSSPSRGDRQWTSDECFFYRTTGCDPEVRHCRQRHFPMCRGIDFQKYMTVLVTY